MSETSQPSFYSARKPIFPRRVKGTFRTFKWAIMTVTLGIYYLTPWIRWDRGPDLPDQAALVDLINGGSSSGSRSGRRGSSSLRAS